MIAKCECNQEWQVKDLMDMTLHVFDHRKKTGHVPGTVIVTCSCGAVLETGPEAWARRYGDEGRGDGNGTQAAADDKEWEAIHLKHEEN